MRTKSTPLSADARRPTAVTTSPRAGGDTSTRKSTNITLAVGLVTEARELGINISQAAEVGIAAEIARRRQERWLSENAEALDSSNAFADRNGLPLARYRNF